VVEREAVREGEEAGAEALHQVPLQVELQDRIHLRPRALVLAATIQDPQVPAVGVRKHAAHDAERASLRQLLPAERGSVGVARRRLGGRPKTRRREQEEAGGRRRDDRIMVRMGALL